MTAPNYTCPFCKRESTLILSPAQAFCTNDDCVVVAFNPSLPDQGMSDVNVIDWKEFKRETNA